LNSAAFNDAPRHPFPRPPPHSPLPPPVPAPPLFACNRAEPCHFKEFCSDGGINSHPTGHDIAKGQASFACILGTQCSDELCHPRVITERILCTDACFQHTAQGGVKWEGSSRNGVCEDGGDFISFRNTVETGTVAQLGSTEGSTTETVQVPYRRIGGCGFGTHHRSKSNPACSSLRTCLYSTPSLPCLRYGLHRLWTSRNWNPFDFLDHSSSATAAVVPATAATSTGARYVQKGA